MQTIVTATSLASFERNIINHLESGWTVIPETVCIAMCHPNPAKASEPVVERYVAFLEAPDSD